MRNLTRRRPDDGAARIAWRAARRTSLRRLGCLGCCFLLAFLLLALD